MTDEKNHGFSEQDFEGEPEEIDPKETALFRRFFYENGGHLVATPEANAGENGIQRGIQKIKATVIGKPLFSKDEIHERLTKFKALAVFGSDAISSISCLGDSSIHTNGKSSL